jgi:predicted DNA-binding protein (MmcQ/YjbR family)
MNIELLREYCLSKKATSEALPFDEDALVFKVCEKMFALTSLSEPNSVNLKCNPEKAIELREHYSCVIPGWHMNKKHWNTINFDNSVSDNLIKEWIDDSYNLVVNGLTKKQKKDIF